MRGLQAGVIIAATVLAVLWFVAVDSTSHSAGDTLRPWLIGVVAIALAAASLVTVLAWLSRQRGG